MKNIFERANELRNAVVSYATYEIKDDSIEYFDDKINTSPLGVIDELLDIIGVLEERLDDYQTVTVEMRKKLIKKNAIIDKMESDRKCKTVVKKAKIENPLNVKCNDTLIFNITVNGKPMDRSDMYYISDYVRACEIAEFLQNENDIEKKQSIELGYRVVDLIDDEGLTEQQAIYEVMNEEKRKRITQIRNTLTDMYGELFSLCDKEEIESELKFVNDAINNFKGE